MLSDSIAPGYMKSEEEHRRDIVIAGRWIHSRHFVAATDGNISIRLDRERILTTPTAISKGLMTTDDLVNFQLRLQDYFRDTAFADWQRQQWERLVRSL